MRVDTYSAPLVITLTYRTQIFVDRLPGVGPSGLLTPVEAGWARVVIGKRPVIITTVHGPSGADFTRGEITVTTVPGASVVGPVSPRTLLAITTVSVFR